MLFLGAALQICYVDESGGFEAYGSVFGSTPLMVIAGVVIEHSHLRDITHEYLSLKARFYPNRFPARNHPLECMLDEIKGADVRRDLRRGRQDSRQAATFLGEVLTMLTKYDARVIGRVWIKEPGIAMSPKSSYTYAIQDIGRHFQHLLSSASELGWILCDGRRPNQDAEVSQSIFTQKHQTSGDSYPNLVETVTFGRSVSHVGLQLADLVTAGLIYPMAAAVYCPAYVASQPGGHKFKSLRNLHGPALKSRRYVYQDTAGTTRGGIVVSDKVGHKPSGMLFP